MARRKFVCGNWKMHKTSAEAVQLVRELREKVASAAAQVAVAPPFTALAAVRQALQGSPIQLFAQNCHHEKQGAFTGEVSAPMLKEIGCDGVILGHSERRQYFGETDETVAQRARAALDAGLRVIACVGETQEEREGGETEEVLRRQLSVLEPHDDLVLAYEPVWAIGTGLTATPEMAQEAHSFIKSLLDAPVLYGGSVKADNAAELLAQADVDGALVGGASLDVDSFRAICETAARIPS